MQKSYIGRTLPRDAILRLRMSCQGFTPGVRGQCCQPPAWKSRDAPWVDGSVSEPKENQ